MIYSGELYGWLLFKRTFLNLHTKIIVLTAPILAQIVILTDFGKKIFLSSDLALFAAHLAYWGVQGFAICIIVGGICCPPLISIWDEKEKQGANDIAKLETVKEMINKIRIEHELERNLSIDANIVDAIRFVDLEKKCMRNFLWGLARFAQLLLLSSSVLTSIRVLKTLI